MADIVMGSMGQWWDSDDDRGAMFSLRQGMHSLLQKPPADALKKLGVADSSPQTAFYEEIVKMAKNSNGNIETNFALGTTILQIEKNQGKSA